MSRLPELSLPWLFLLGLLLPFVLLTPLLVEHRRGRDGPRVVPETTLKSRRTPRSEAGRTEEPPLVPGLTRVPVDLEVLEGTEMKGNVVTGGRFSLEARAALRGSAKARTGIRLGEAARVYGNLVAGGDVDLGRRSYVQGLVYAAGHVTLRPGAVVKALYAGGRVAVYPGAEILEDVMAEEGVHLVVPADTVRAMEELETLNTLLNPDEYLEDEE